MKVELKLRWDDVESNPGETYRFPEELTAYMQRYREPSVYRWAVFSNDGMLEAVYVGEAEDLRRRLKDYLSPGNRKTALRISQFLRDRHLEGKEIRFQMVAFEDFAVNLCQFDCRKLSDPFARKVIENLAILNTLRSKCQVLNKGVDVNDKKVEAISNRVLDLTTAQQSELMKKLRDSVKANAVSGT